MPTKSDPKRWSYSQRKQNGRPTVTYCLPQDTINTLGKLAEYFKLSRSAVVDLAVKELAKRFITPAE